MNRPRILLAVSLLAMIVGETGCLFRTRLVEMRTSNAKLLTATKQELVDRINTEATKIKTLNATVNIATSVGGEKKGKVTEYEEIRGYILLRKPDMLRMIGLFPIVRNKAFDMVSQGNEFKLSIPSRSKFYVGHNDVVHPGGNSLESLRPQVIYNALLLPEIDPKNDIAVMESSTEIIYDPKTKKNLEQPDYVIDIIHHGKDDWYLSRKVIIDRTTLVPHRQIIYDTKWNIDTDVTYQVYQDYNGVSFPNVIMIDRPQEEYSIRLTVDKLVINEPLRDDQFALQQPPGSVVVDLDQPNQTASSNATPAPAHSDSNPPKKYAPARRNELEPFVFR
jgi:outer membrane lipoprotein-sorting protein